MRLLFRKEFFDGIRAGRKTQTVRLWARQWVRAGAICEIPNLGFARILQVTPIDLEDLTETDARADGFDSLRGLLAKITEIYGPERPADRQFYRVAFAFLGEERPVEPALFE